MPALPLVLSFLAAGLITPAALRSLVAQGHVRENYRRRSLPFPAGFLVVAAAVLALVPLALLEELAGADDVLRPELRSVAVYVLGVAFLGLVDDAFAGPSRGWRGHGRAVLRGSFATGALKAVGSLGLALYVLSGRGYGAGDYLLAVAVVLLATNLFNLLDLRPGRSVKGFVLLGAGLTLGEWDLDPLWALGLFAGAVLALGVWDVRERAMLGDTGSNVIGALAGLWLVLALGTTGRIVAAAVLLAITAYGEFRSLSELIEGTPGLRHLDSFGRPA
jgi:UDP-N-acetylmuramyl pentapeptide phosphotransferase/UDP-N-acetylglucosamine-1-phosphate transferase